ncbi:hypothetical protein [Lentzea sp. NPDC092896]|uniref:hypothetical protein n=1 Tax=Lentzea sp. NPDC092896 TaxID=3364127 RepID=UPI00381901E9
MSIVARHRGTRELRTDTDVPEHDTVLVVDPARIVDGEALGLQRLHVALTGRR